MANRWAQEWGLVNLKQNPNLLKLRFETFLPDPILTNLENTQNITNELIQHLSNTTNINLSQFTHETIFRTTKKGFKLNWHKDHYNPSINLKLSREQGKKIYHWNKCMQKIPKYTALIYFNNYGSDFKGGLLKMADNTIITPKRGLTIFFDSEEVHCVTQQTSGERKIVLIKFYNK